MKKVSQQFIDTTNLTVRPPTQFRATLDLRDDSINEGAITSSPLKMPFSTQIIGSKHQCDYITLEKDFFEVGGKQFILPDNPEDVLQNGYVSDEIADLNGNFSKEQKFVFKFNEPKSFVGISYDFVNTFPLLITVSCFLSGRQVLSFTSKPRDLHFEDRTNKIPLCDTINITFSAIKKQSCRLRIAKIQFGLEIVFDGRNTTSFNLSKSADPLSSKLPTTKFNMSVLNFDKEYNMDNPKGSWAYFKTKRPLKVEMGVYNDFATPQQSIEWVTADTVILSDAPKTTRNLATFEGTDILSTLAGDFVQKDFYKDGISLFDFATKIFADAEFSNYELDESLRNIKTTAILPKKPHKECLQLIANAGCCSLYCDNFGKVIMKRIRFDGTNIENYLLDYSKQLSQIELIPSEELKTLIVDVYSNTLGEKEEEVASASFETFDKEENQNTTISFSANSIDVKVGETVNCTVEIISKSLESATCFVKADDGTKNVSFSLIGTPIRTSSEEVYLKGVGEGSVCHVKNPLITNLKNLGEYGTWVESFLRNRFFYKSEIRQDYIVDLLDKIKVDTEFSKNSPAIITKIDINYPGQKGGMELRRLGI